MSAFPVGCYVMHKKLSDLGSGEVVMVDKGAIRIRFASGERSFLEAYVGSHLEVTADAPLVVASAARKRAPRKPSTKTAAKRKGISPSSRPVASPVSEE